MTDVHTGSSFESFLEEQGCLEEVDAVAIKHAIAWKLEQTMARERITKVAMAKRMNTSRSQLDRLLDPTNAQVHLTTIVRAAAAVGHRVKISLDGPDTSPAT